jgi:hypothetical protein
MLRAQIGLQLAWEMIRENITISAIENLGYNEVKKHKPWFYKQCSKLLDQKKQVKLQWLQDPSEINGDNLNNVRRETSTFQELKKGKNRINYIAMNSKTKNIRDPYRGINEFKRSY